MREERPILSHAQIVIPVRDRRRVVDFDISKYPTAQWTAQQVVEAFPWDSAPRFLPRDRDGVYGTDFRKRVQSMGIEEVIIAARSPWQTPYIERMIGSIRRECLDHAVVLSERHLRRILQDYFSRCPRWRCHQSLEMDCPAPRPVQPPEVGAVLRYGKLAVCTGTRSGWLPDGRRAERSHLPSLPYRAMERSQE